MGIQIPDHLLEKVGKNIGPDFTKVDIKLKNGKMIKNLIVREKKYIVGINYNYNENVLNFSMQDIKDLRPSSFFRKVFNIW